MVMMNVNDDGHDERYDDGHDERYDDGHDDERC